MDQVMQFVEPGRQFVKDSIRLVKRCTKPDRKEFQKIAMATAIGFAIMGFIGFFVKLIHIPINNIIVAGASLELSWGSKFARCGAGLDAAFWGLLGLQTSGLQKMRHKEMKSYEGKGPNCNAKQEKRRSSLLAPVHILLLYSEFTSCSSPCVATFTLRVSMALKGMEQLLSNTETNTGVKGRESDGASKKKTRP
ncbi:hypothetical protein P4O66_004816, partial [Electrophorus voltai]